MKLNSTPKSRACTDGTDGIQQWLQTNKEDVLLSTPNIKGLKFTLIIDAQKGDVATVDLSAQIFQPEMDQVIHLEVGGPLTLLLVQHDPDTCKKHFRTEKEHSVIMYFTIR